MSEQRYTAAIGTLRALVRAADDAVDFLDDQAADYEILHGCTGDRTGDQSSPPMFCDCDRCSKIDQMRIKSALLDSAVRDAKAALDALQPGSVAALVEAAKMAVDVMNDISVPVGGRKGEDLQEMADELDEALAPFWGGAKS